MEKWNPGAVWKKMSFIIMKKKGTKIHLAVQGREVKEKQKPTKTMARRQDYGCIPIPSMCS